MKLSPASTPSRSTAHSWPQKLLGILTIVTCIALIFPGSFTTIDNFAASHLNNFFSSTGGKTSSGDKTFANGGKTFTDNQFFTNHKSSTNGKTSTNDHTFTNNGKTRTCSGSDFKNFRIKGEGCEKICAPENMKHFEDLGRMGRKMGRTASKTHECWGVGAEMDDEFKEHMGEFGETMRKAFEGW